MARIDDYKESFRLASMELEKRDAAAMAEAAGAVFSPQEGLIVSFLGTKYRIEIYPPDIRKAGSSEEIPLPDKILIAHYLLGSTGKILPANLLLFARFRMAIFILKRSRGAPETLLRISSATAGSFL